MLKNDLETKGFSSSTRCCKELDKYKVGKIFKTPWGDLVKITKVTRYTKLEEIPTWKYFDKGMKISARQGEKYGGGKWDHVFFEKAENKINSKLIAPCGMNCGICIGYLRDKNKCPGCRNMSENNPEYCKKCIIRNCEILKEHNWKFCSDKCEKYPCKRLKSLDKRYSTKYGMSMIENLKNIQKSGIRKFVKDEKQRWKCKKCGTILCVHRDNCLICGYKK